MYRGTEDIYDNKNKKGGSVLNRLFHKITQYTRNIVHAFMS